MCNASSRTLPVETILIDLMTHKLERDKINTFWEITKRQLENTKAELRNKDRELEELEERHAVEIKVWKSLCSRIEQVGHSPSRSFSFINIFAALYAARFTSKK